MKYVIIDTEGNGLFDFKRPADAEGQPRLASLAMIFLGDYREMFPVERVQTFLIKPDGWVMSEGAEAVNGLSTDHLTAHGVPVRDALVAWTAAIEAGYVAVAYNAQHDLKQIRAELRRAGMPDLFERTPNICAMRALTGVCKIPKATGKGYKFPKLAEAMAHFKLPQSGAHTAAGDAHSCLMLFRKAMELGMLIRFTPTASRGSSHGHE